MSSAGALLVVAPNWLGDAVMALPAMADLKQYFGDRRMIVAARSSVSSLFAMVPGVADIVDADVAAVRAAAPEIAVLFPNSFASAWLTWRAAVPQRWGYATDLRTRLLTRAIRRSRQSMHQGAYYQHLVAELGVANGPLEPRIEIPRTATAMARTLLRQHGWDDGQPLVVLAPGAAYGKAKQWIPSYVTQLISDLVRERPMRCALVGSRGDAQTTHDIRDAAPKELQAAIFDLAGATTLPVLAGVIAMASACVSNDSGAMHLAAAAGVPVVGIFGSTNEKATSPLAHDGVPAVVLTNTVWCRPCRLRECPIDHRCMTGIEPARVLAAVNRVARVPA
jgi:heptosyltransferase-2